MDMKHEKRINEVMDSLDGIQSAEVNPFLYNRILNKIQEVKPESTPAKLVWLTAASFALLAVLNIQAIRINISGKEKTSEIRELASGYQLINSNSINY